MKKTKDKILETSKYLFNTEGTGNVSLRQVASEMGISHGNLMYHYKTKNEIIDALHEQMFKQAQEINTNLLIEDFSLWELFNSLNEGFKVVYEYRFFMIDLNLIMRENKKLNEIFRAVEQTRATMYRDVFQQSINLGIMRPEAFSGEYESLIERIRIFSDAWVASSEIYDKDKTPLEIIEKYSRLFQNQLFPYLSEKGIEEFLHLRKQKCT